METYNSLILLAMVLFISCQSTIENNEEFKSPILEYYIEKYDLNGNPNYISIFSEEQNDSLYRYTWTLDKANMTSHLPILFEEFASEIFIQTEDKDYQLFDVVFDRRGRIHQVGLFDALDRFTGIVYDYDFQQNLILIEAQMWDKRFYEVFYHLDDLGEVSDSSYQYFPIVNPDVSHFDGPELSICFEVKLIIHRKKYNYEDFSMWYQFYDIENTTDLPNKVDKSIIYESDMLESKDGFYHICHDLELKYHLMPVFGIFADDNVSEQDLTFGEMKDPIINKNIDSTEL